MQIAVTGIHMRTVDRKSYGQWIEVVAVLTTGEEKLLIREFGALPDVMISHHVGADGVLNVPLLDSQVRQA